MKQVDLGPDDYKIRDPKTGRWQTPANPKLVGVMFLVLVAVLVFIFFHRDEMTSETLFGIVSLASLFAGLTLGLSVRKTY